MRRKCKKCGTWCEAGTGNNTGMGHKVGMATGSILGTFVVPGVGTKIGTFIGGAVGHFVEMGMREDELGFNCKKCGHSWNVKKKS